VSAAREVWFVNDPIRAWHAEQYPGAADRMHVVANGWDPGLLERVPRRAAEGPVRFAYLGTVTPKVPLAELLEGWRTAVSDGRVPAGSTLTIGGHLGYFAVPQGRLADLVRESADAGVSYVGAVPKAEVGAFYESADVLVLALGSGRYVTSGKVYEYVAAGRPVVAVHDPQNATTSVLADHPLVARAERIDGPAVADALAEGARMARTVDPAVEARVEALADSYRRDHQLEPRVAALREAVGR
jgi:glycosyltransferase involved in cell wall biosynthesis